MNKQEFLEKLSEALREDMSESSAYEHVSYYNNYIDEEVRKGRTEEDVIAGLGNPRLLAKSIIDRGGYTSSKSARTSYSMGKFSSSFDETGKTSEYTSIKVGIVGIILAVVVVAALFLVLWGISWLVLKVILPIVIVLIIVGAIVALINSFKRR